MIPIVWVTGAPGVGKTAVAWRIFENLRRSGADPAYVDVDQLGMLAPAPDGDPGRHRLKERNVVALRGNFAVDGARLLVVSGVVDPVHGPDLGVLGGPRVRVARLRADPDALRTRLRSRNGQLRPPRGSPSQDDDAVAFADALDRSDFADRCIDTTGRSIDEVADSVLRDDAWFVTGREALDTSAGGLQASPAAGEVLWISGPTGVGKSTVGYRAYMDVLRSGARAAFVDVDQLGFGVSDQDAPATKAHNLATVWRNYANAGAQFAVVVGGVTTSAEARRYEETLPMTTITWCRLRVDDEELVRRIRSRGTGGSWAQPGDPLRGRSDAELQAVADAAVATASVLDQEATGIDVDIDGLDVHVAAEQVLRTTRWPTTHQASEQ